MKLRTFTAAAGFIASALLIQPLNAQCYSQGTIYATNRSANYELAQGGMLCAAQMPTLVLPGTQHAISMCLLAPDATVQIQLTIRNGIWGTYSVPAVGKVLGGTPDPICFAVPAAITGLRVVPNGDTRAEIGLGISF